MLMTSAAPSASDDQAQHVVALIITAVLHNT
jgi:hypothetical protein